MNAHRYRQASTLLWLLALPWLLFPEAVPLMVVPALALLLLLRLGARRWYGYTIRRTFLDGFWLLFLLLTLVSYAASPLPAHSLSKLTVVLAGLFAYYLLQDWLEAGVDLRHLALLLAAGGAALALLSLFTVAWPAANQVVDLGFLYRLLPGRDLVHRNQAAAALLLLLPFSVAAISDVPAGIRRYLAVAGSLLMLLVLLLTQSRAALLALAIVLPAWALLRRERLRLLLPAGLALVVALILLLAFSPRAAQAAGRWVAPLDVATKAGSGESWLVRLELWQAAGRTLHDYPVIGAGLFTFYPVARSNYIFQHVAFDEDLRHAHNLFLQGGADMGWPGLLLTLLLWGAIIWALLAVTRPAATPDDPHVARWGPVWYLSLLAFLLFNLVDVLALGHRPGLLIWLVLGGVAALVRLQPRPLHIPRPLVLTPALLLFLLTLPFLPRNLANGQLDRYVLGGRGTLPPAGQFAGDPLRQGRVAFLNGDDAAALAYWQQDEAGAAFARDRGFVAHRAGRAGQALRLYTLSLALDAEQGRTYYWRALVQAGQGEYAAAAADLEQALQFTTPEEDDSWLALIQYHLGRVLAEQGDLEEARQHLQQAVQLDETQSGYAALLADVMQALGEETP